MSSLCPFQKYSNVFGEPGEGVHSYRFLNTAMVDYILSILGAILITYYTDIPLVLTTIIVLILGVLSHMLFGIPTETIKYLGLNCS